MIGKAILLTKSFRGALENAKDDALDSFDSFLGRSAIGMVDIQCEKRFLGKGDGRWMIQPAKISETSLVYSVGVGHDISFDLDLIATFGCQVHAFDPTSISKSWLEKQKLPDKFIFHPIGLGHFNGLAEFSLPQGHSVSFSMMSGISGAKKHQAMIKTLDSIMDELGHSSIDILKIDIEGAEYNIIDDLCEKCSSIGQLLIEFHDRLVPEGSADHSTNAIKRLKQAGYQLFHHSRRGLEYSFQGRK